MWRVQVKTLGDAEYTVCYYTTGDWLENTGRCQAANRSLACSRLPVPPFLTSSWLCRYGAAAMACLPLFWRMMQCLGRYSATKHVEVRCIQPHVLPTTLAYSELMHTIVAQHLGNSTKYLVALSVVLLSQLYGDLSSSGTSRAISLCLLRPFIVMGLCHVLCRGMDGYTSAVVHCLYRVDALFVRALLLPLSVRRFSSAVSASILCRVLHGVRYVWDIFMDWGLGRWHSQNFPLRDELFYSNRYTHPL
jgi:hypothetical protein